MRSNKMMISRILDYIIVDDCIFKTQLKYYISNSYLSVTTNYTINHATELEHIDITNKEFKDNIKTNVCKYSKRYHEANRDTSTNRIGSIEARINHSCIMRNIDIEDFNGFADKSRPYIKPVHDCIKMNEWFNGSHAHHITKSIIIYIPSELHRHIPHNLRTGHNMGEINALSIQFVNGGL